MLHDVSSSFVLRFTPRLLSCQPHSDRMAKELEPGAWLPKNGALDLYATHGLMFQKVNKESRITAAEVFCQGKE